MNFYLLVQCYLFQRESLHCVAVFLTLFLISVFLFDWPLFFSSRFYFENDFEIFFISFFPPLFFQFYFFNFIFLVSVACLALEYISPRILQNQINMFGVLVVVLVVQFTKTKVAIHANVSWSSVASRSVSFWEVFFSSSSRANEKILFF